jgi:hypothetical protein
MDDLNLYAVAGAVLLLNIPFGYWRQNVPRLSLQWFTAIHMPVPAVIALRLVSGIGYRLVTFPVLVGSFFAGQYLGARIHRARERKECGPVSSCLVMDLVRAIRRG